MIAIALSSNRAELGKIPAGDEAAWRVFNGSFKNTTIEPQRFCELVGMGYAYTTQHNGYRSADKFLAGQHLALDYDTRDQNSSISSLVNDPFINRYASFIHTTPSHTDDRPKSRVVFCLDRPVRDVGKYAELAQSLVWKFQMADKACKDAARFFYGAKGCKRHWLGNILTLEDAARELVFPYREGSKRTQTPYVTQNIVAAAGVSPGLLKKHSQSLLEKVQTALDGDKYYTLRNVAVTFGGYVAGEYYDRGQVEEWLQNAIANNPNNVQDLKAAYKTIELAIAYGMERPLYFELQQDGPQAQIEVPELTGIHPPLTPIQQKQVIAVMRDREWRAYHDGMTAGERALWRGKGMDDVVIDMLNLGVKHDIDEETGEISDVMTLPYVRGGEIVNVEYRGREVSYASDAPSLYFPEESQKSTPVLVMADSLDAIKMWLNYGHCYRIAGLPQLTVNQTMFEGDEYIIGICPGMDIAGTGLMKLEGKVKFTQFPVNVGKLIEYGMTPEQLGQYIRYASKILA